MTTATINKKIITAKGGLKKLPGMYPLPESLKRAAGLLKHKSKELDRYMKRIRK